MANREEKIKKINAELEKLDDEQLDAVSGGMFIKDYHLKPNNDKSPEQKKIDEYIKLASEYEKTRVKK